MNGLGHRLYCHMASPGRPQVADRRTGVPVVRVHDVGLPAESRAQVQRRQREKDELGAFFGDAAVEVRPGRDRRAADEVDRHAVVGGNVDLHEDWSAGEMAGHRQLNCISSIIQFASGLSSQETRRPVGQRR